MNKKPFPITWSKLNTYETCPWKFWLLYGSKFVEGKATIPFQTSPALEKGNKMHETMEVICNEPVGRRGLTNDHYLAQQWWIDTAVKLIGSYSHHTVEEKLALGTKWEKIVLDKWWQPYRKELKALFQGKLDLVCFNNLPLTQRANATEAYVVDWKSGKVRKSELEMGQLASQAMLLFINIPELEKITASYIWLEHKAKQTKTFERSDLPKMKENFGNRFGLIHKKLLGGEKCFPPHGSGCHWCPATREHCRYAS